MIHFSCPTCRFAVHAPDDCAGRTTNCPKCHYPITVPKAEGPEAHPGSPSTSPVTTPEESGRTRMGRLLSHVPDEPAPRGPIRPAPAQGAYSPELIPEWSGDAKQSSLGMFVITATIVGGIALTVLVVLIAVAGGDKSKVKARSEPMASVRPKRQPPAVAREPKPEPQLPGRSPAGMPAQPPAPGIEPDPPPKQQPKAKPQLPQPQPPPEPQKEPPAPGTKEKPEGNQKPPSGGPSPERAEKETKKKDDDLPDVGLEIPPETRPEVKAILRDNWLRLYSKSASERAKAAQVLGELGEQGKPVRRVLCWVMLDPIESVRVAAADALKKIDPRIQYLAVALVTEQDDFKRRDLLVRIQQLKDDGEPLTPLVATWAGRSSLAGKVIQLQQELTTLSFIATKDRESYKLIFSALSNRDEGVRRSALQALPRMKHGRQAVPAIIALLQTDTTANRLAAIRALPALADESNEERITAAIARLRYHSDQEIRKAVEIALNQIQVKVKP